MYDVDYPTEGVPQGDQGLGSYDSMQDKNIRTVDADIGSANAKGDDQGSTRREYQNTTIQSRDKSWTGRQLSDSHRWSTLPRRQDLCTERRSTRRSTIRSSQFSLFNTSQWNQDVQRSEATFLVERDEA